MCLCLCLWECDVISPCSRLWPIVNESTIKHEKNIAFSLIIGWKQYIHIWQEGEKRNREREKKKQSQTCLDCKLGDTVVHDSDHMNRIDCGANEWGSESNENKNKYNKGKKFTLTTYVNALYFSELAFVYLFWFVHVLSISLWLHLLALLCLVAPLYLSFSLKCRGSV